MNNKMMIPLGLVVLILIISGVWYFTSSEDKKAENMNPAPTNTAMKKDSGKAMEKPAETAKAPTMEKLTGTALVEGDLKAGTYEVVAEKSTFAWTGKKTLIPNWIDTGVINVKEGDVTLTDTEVSAGKIVVDMSSIVAKNTGMGAGGNDKLTTHLKSADWFDVTTYPIAEFVMTTAKANSPSEYMVEGSLTMHGKTNPEKVTLKAMKLADGNIGLTGTMVIDRSKYDVKYGSETLLGNLGDKAIDDNFSLDLSIVLAMSK